MSAPDMLEIINGPEDGTEFPISRAPVIVGMDLACEVHVRLDESIERQHARLSVVSDGYRVRKVRGGRLYVDGKRTGVLRSRILRDGGTLEVGNTEFCLHCSPEGLAKRSRGLPVESDVFWAMRAFGKRLFGMLRGSGGRPRNGLVRLLRTLLILFVITALIGYFFPNAMYYARGYLNYGVGWVMEQVAAMTGGPF